MCETSFLKTDLKLKLAIIVMTDFIRSISHGDWTEDVKLVSVEQSEAL